MSEVVNENVTGTVEEEVPFNGNVVAQSETHEITDEEKAKQKEVQDLVGYIMGTVTEPPESINKMLTNLYKKLQVGLGYSIASNVSRQSKLAKFIASAEEELFDSEQVKTMDHEELKDAYNAAVKTYDGMNEFERRFLAQNKETFLTEKSDQERIAAQLMTLSPEKLDSVMKIIKGETDIEKSEDGVDF